MGHPREYRADKTNERLEWMILDAHVVLIIFYNLRNSFHFWNETILYCPSNSFVSSQMKDKHTTTLNSFISWTTKNEWTNERTRLNVAHMQQKTYFFEITRHFRNTSLYIQLRWCLTLVWHEMKKIIVKNKQKCSKQETQNLEIRHATIKSKALRLFFIYLHVTGQKSTKLQRSLLPQSQVITSTVAVNWEVSISSCLSPEIIPNCLLFQAVLRTS